MAETSRLLFPSIRFCIASPSRVVPTLGPIARASVRSRYSVRNSVLHTKEAILLTLPMAACSAEGFAPTPGTPSRLDAGQSPGQQGKNSSARDRSPGIFRALLEALLVSGNWLTLEKKLPQTPAIDWSMANLVNFKMAAFVRKGKRSATASFAIPCTSDHAYNTLSCVFPAGSWPPS